MRQRKDFIYDASQPVTGPFNKSWTVHASRQFWKGNIVHRGKLAGKGIVIFQKNVKNNSGFDAEVVLQHYAEGQDERGQAHREIIPDCAPPSEQESVACFDQVLQSLER